MLSRASSCLVLAAAMMVASSAATDATPKRLAGIQGKRDNDAVGWTEMYINYAGDWPIVPNDDGYVLNDRNRQHLHVYTPPNAKGPVPVLFWSHGNPGSANSGVDSFLIPEASRAGYAVVSWESVTPLSDDVRELNQCQTDLELAMNWVVANGADYNLSSEDWIVGGRSRGSLCSWTSAHSGRGAIKGMYLYGALPLLEESAWEGGELTGTVTSNSPPAYFAYGQCCPKPIITSGPDKCIVYKEDNPQKEDIHNPRNGQRIVNRYEELKMGEDITLTDCMIRDLGAASNPLYYFSTFVESLGEDSPFSGAVSESPSLLVFIGAVAALRTFF